MKKIVVSIVAMSIVFAATVAMLMSWHIRNLLAKL